MIEASNFAINQRWHTPCYDKLNDLGWNAGRAILSHGVRIGIRTDDPDVMAALVDRLPSHARQSEYNGKFDCVLSVINGGTAASRGLRKFSLLYENHTRVARVADFEAVLDRFEAHFRLVEAALSPKFVFVHAGVVGHLGNAIVLPGETHSGKSELISALVRAGATYYSDEYAVIDSNGRIHPYAKPILLRDRAGQNSYTTAEAIGGVTGTQPLKAGMLIFTRFEAGSKWRPEPVNASVAFLNLLANCVCAQIAPERSVAHLAKLAVCPSRIITPRCEAEPSAAEILGLMKQKNV